MQALRGQPDTIAVSHDELPTIDAPAYRWLYVSNPLAWELVDLEAAGLSEDERGGKRFEWLPRLKTFALRAGVNGVREPRPGALDWSHAEVTHKRWGDIVIPEDAAPDGRSYRQAVQTAKGKRYPDVWTEYKRVGHSWQPRFDKLGFLRWRRDLVLDGVIPVPDIEDLEGQIRAFERIVDQKRIDSRYQGTEKLAEQEARLAAMRDPTSMPSRPAPKPKRRRRAS